MRRLILLMAFIGLVASAVPAPAQTPSPEAMAAARELVVVMQAADRFKAIFPMIIQQLKPAIVQNRPAVEKDYDAIMPLIVTETNARIGELVEQMAAIYAQNFTVTELHEVTAFYRTPTGQKIQQKTPEIAQQSMIAGQKFGEKLTDDLQKRITDELRKRGHNI